MQVLTVCACMNKSIAVEIMPRLYTPGMHVREQGSRAGALAGALDRGVTMRPWTEKASKENIAYVLVFFVVVVTIAIIIIIFFIIVIAIVIAIVIVIYVTHLLPTPYDLRPTTYDLLPTTYYQRPTTYDLRPTTNDLRPTTLITVPSTVCMTCIHSAIHSAMQQFQLICP